MEGEVATLCEVWHKYQPWVPARQGRVSQQTLQVPKAEIQQPVSNPRVRHLPRCFQEPQVGAQTLAEAAEGRGGLTLGLTSVSEKGTKASFTDTAQPSLVQGPRGPLPQPHLCISPLNSKDLANL